MKKIYKNDILCFLLIMLTLFCFFLETKQEIIQVEIQNQDFGSVPQQEIKIIEKSGDTFKYKELNNVIDEIENIKEQYKEMYIARKSIYDIFTEEEINLICRVVETECYQQDFDSKVNIANVVFNRYYSGKFGDTITEVVTSPYQFAYGRKNITEDTVLAVIHAFGTGDTTQGALYFHSNNKTDTFCGRIYKFTDDAGHHFY